MTFLKVSIVLFFYSLSAHAGVERLQSRCGDLENTSLESTNLKNSNLMTRPGQSHCEPQASKSAKAMAISDLVYRSRMAVSSFPTSLNVLEANELIIMQGDDQIVIAGIFFSAGNRVEAIDALTRAEELKFNFVTISSDLYDQLDKDLLKKELERINGNAEFETFMGATRYLGYARVGQTFNQNFSTASLQKIYEKKKLSLQ